VPVAVSILSLNPKKSGGIERFLCELSRKLHLRGWRSVLCFTHEPPEPVRAALELPNVTIEVLPGFKGSFSFSDARQVRRILVKYRPEVVHFHYTGFVSLLPWAARLTGVPKVFFADRGGHPEDYVPRRSLLYKRVLSRLLNRPLTAVFCVSDYNRQCFVARDLINKQKILRIYNGVDYEFAAQSVFERSAACARYGVPPDRNIVLQICNMTYEKGVGDFLEAARIVHSAMPGKVHFVLAGEGCAKPHYMNVAEEMGLGGAVTWTGLIENPLSDGIYYCADLTCLLSSCNESFGFVIAEAMACGKPVIATKVGGIPEVVSDGETGFLVDKGSPGQVVDRMLTLLRDENLRRKLGESGRERVRTLFGLSENVEQVVALYGAK
jgi:glycosyltransferase involved in cell wall biosynthesis